MDTVVEDRTISFKDKEITQNTNFLEYLVFLRDGYTNDIPPQILHSTSAEVKEKGYKVRKAWWTQLVGALDFLIDEGRISNPDIMMETDNFINYYTAEEFGRQPLVRKDDIDRGNKMINRVLGIEQNPVTVPELEKVA